MSNTQPASTVTDATHAVGLSGGSPAEPTALRVGERAGDQRVAPKAGPNSAHLITGQVPTLLRGETLWPPPQYFSPLVQEEGMKGADSQGAGEQGRPVRRNTCQEYKPPSCGVLLARQPGEDGTETKTRENQGERTQGQQPPSVSAAMSSVTVPTARNQGPQMAERPKQTIRQLRLCQLPRLSRAG